MLHPLISSAHISTTESEPKREREKAFRERFSSGASHNNKVLKYFKGELVIRAAFAGKKPNSLEERVAFI